MLTRTIFSNGINSISSDKFGHNGGSWKKANSVDEQKQITEAITRGRTFKAINNDNKTNSATRYVHPTAGKSVVIDDVIK